MHTVVCRGAQERILEESVLSVTGYFSVTQHQAL